MKVAGNRVQHLIDYFHSELDALYGKEETAALISAVFEHFLGFKRNEVFRRAQENINQSDLLKIYFFCKDLKRGKPLQYILEEAWFYNLKFYVNTHVLIPRPETEELVDMIIKENPTCSSLLDIGTGSGCIPLSIKKHIAACRTVAVDTSRDALHVAEENGRRLNLEVTFIEANALDTASLADAVKNRFEIIVSNPPYVKLEEKEALHANVREFEPHLALFVEGEDDIVFYKRIIDGCVEILQQKGRLYFELNPLTSEKVEKYALGTEMFSEVKLRKDMSGKTRFLKAVKK